MICENDYFDYTNMHRKSAAKVGFFFFQSSYKMGCKFLPLKTLSFVTIRHIYKPQYTPF